MPRRPITQPAEYWLIARRRWLWIVVPALAVSAGTIAIARKLPKLYRSEALILVEPQKVPADLVKPTVSSSVALRLESIEEQILSRTELSQIIQKYGLYQGGHLTEDAQITKMLGDIQVTTSVDPEQRDPQVTAFRISYAGRDPLIAQQVTRELSSLFIAENLKARAQQAQGTETFIDGQLQGADDQLRAAAEQLRQLKSSYMGSLPEQQSANLQVLAQLNSVLQANTEGLARAQQQKLYLTSLAQAASGAAAPNLPAAPSQAQQDLDKARSELAVAQQEYTAANPDVIRLQLQVKALMAVVAGEKAAAAKAAPATAAASAPQERGQIALLDQEIQQRTADQATTRAKIAQMQANLGRLPEVEEKLANLQSAYDEAKANDIALQQKKAAASAAAAMEQQAEGEEFRIMDPADLPQKPASPNLLRIDLLGALGGLLLGLGLAWSAEARKAVIRGEADLDFYAKVPVLAELPWQPALLGAGGAGVEPARGGRL